MASGLGFCLQLFATWLFVWALLMILYLGVLEAIDRLTGAWNRFRRGWLVAGELARIDQDAAAAIQRVGTAFDETQRKLRAQRLSARATASTPRRGGAGR